MNHKKMQRKLIVAITGASGAIYGVRMLEALNKVGVETHLVLSNAAKVTLKAETNIQKDDLISKADYYYPITDIGAAIASGSFPIDGMIVAPCSIKTMSEIACGITSNLISRAADVVLKERRKLVLMVRETPFHLGHIRTMEKLTEMGAIVAPPLPAFYSMPKTIDDLVDHSVGRILDLFDIENDLSFRWKGDKSSN
jgi:4-hydroxy-3-polyprenylbenzoate decarboxylase